MIFECLTCGGDFEDHKGSARLTCSQNCREEYQQFLQKLNKADPENRQEMMDKFFQKIDEKEVLNKFKEILKNAQQK